MSRFRLWMAGLVAFLAGLPITTRLFGRSSEDPTCFENGVSLDDSVGDTFGV